MIKKILEKYEYVLLLATMFMCMFGLLLLYSASSYYCINKYQNEYYLVFRQGIYMILGFIVLICVSFIPYKFIFSMSNIIYISSFCLVMLTFFVGVASRGSTRWVEINGITFQPSELMKIGIIMHLSKSCSEFLEKQNEYDEVRYQKEYYKIFFLGFVPSMIISVSNLSTGIICGIITICYVFLISKKKLVFLVLVLFIFSIFVFKYPIALIIEKVGILKQYQMNRILAWVSPKDYEDIAYQTNQSLYAIGAGGIYGRGIGESLQKMIIPEVQNDMIFAVLVEEVGIVGSILFMLMYMLMLFRIFYLSYVNDNVYKSLILFGVGIHIFLQIVLNIAVCLNIIPNTGIVLPFASYGGSSLVVTLCEIGVCIAVSK